MGAYIINKRKSHSGAAVTKHRHCVAMLMAMRMERGGNNAAAAAF